MKKLLLLIVCLINMPLLIVTAMEKPSVDDLVDGLVRKMSQSRISKPVQTLPVLSKRLKETTAQVSSCAKKQIDLNKKAFADKDAVDYKGRVCSPKGILLSNEWDLFIAPANWVDNSLTQFSYFVTGEIIYLYDSFLKGDLNISFKKKGDADYLFEISVMVPEKYSNEPITQMQISNTCFTQDGIFVDLAIFYTIKKSKKINNRIKKQRFKKNAACYIYNAINIVGNSFIQINEKHRVQ